MSSGSDFISHPQPCLLPHTHKGNTGVPFNSSFGGKILTVVRGHSFCRGRDKAWSRYHPYYSGLLVAMVECQSKCLYSKRKSRGIYWENVRVLGIPASGKAWPGAHTGCSTLDLSLSMEQFSLCWLHSHSGPSQWLPESPRHPSHTSEATTISLLNNFISSPVTASHCLVSVLRPFSSQSLWAKGREHTDWPDLSNMLISRTKALDQHHLDCEDRQQRASIF